MIIRERPIQFSNYIVYFILLSLAACTDENINSSKGISASLTGSFVIAEDSVILRQNQGLVYYKKKPFTGTTIAKYPNGKNARSIDYVNGKKHGKYCKWFDNGLKSFEANYENGKQHGITQSWWRNDKLRTKSNYKKGIPHGEQLQWYKSGAKFKKITLNQGIEEGLQQSWRENGKLYNNYEARDGRIFGLKRAKLCYGLDDEIIQYQTK